ncbi:transporter substrate-binding domain-containing protein [Roseateles asaccharophilus]|uniref:Polar amino acid transport system substrate-binding protein n=1 Tax=Roseateles asaccharophilus TaxID=582607 RepID=A0ABU2ADS3_9BURK|nr:transporter substrate-binding domain-containing protein [Roseateles asaccharophilus]MDR7335349.1 polar amino acid transport system substrate-binding protein [Roseateles asaccharophilus]
MAPLRLLLLLAALLLPGAALACGPYRVAFYEYAILYHRDTDGQYRGIDKDVLDELARRTGCRFDTVLESRARTWALMTSGGLDITLSAVVNRERERIVELVPYLQSRRAVVLRNPSVPSTAEAFMRDEQRRLLKVRAARDGPQMEALLARLEARGRVVEAADQPSAVRAFKAGRADAMVLGIGSLARLRQQDPEFQAYDAVFWAPTERVVGALAMSRERVSEADRARLREAIAAMRRDGGLDAILRRHVGDKLAAALRLPDGDSGH